MNDASAGASRSIRDYIEIENIEQTRASPDYLRCCYNVLEVMKALVMHIKIESVYCKWKRTTEDFIAIRAVLIVVGV